MPFDKLRRCRRTTGILAGYLRANRSRIAGILVLFLLLASSTHAAAPLRLSLWSVNDRGAADLLPGSRVLVVVELRSAEPQSATLTHATPPGLSLEQATASAGTIAPGLMWSGVVSSTQPINISLLYSVPRDTTPGDRVLSVSGQAGDVPFAASTVLRVCCIEAPAPSRPVYERLLPIVLR